MPFSTRLNLKLFEVFEVHFPTDDQAASDNTECDAMEYYARAERQLRTSLDADEVCVHLHLWCREDKEYGDDVF
jgi:hypothetical protein